MDFYFSIPKWIFNEVNMYYTYKNQPEWKWKNKTKLNHCTIAFVVQGERENVLIGLKTGIHSKTNIDSL